MAAVDLSVLTDRQRELFAFICGNVREQGRPPTFRQIGDAMGIRSPNGVRCHLEAIQKKGFVSGVSRGQGCDHPNSLRVTAGEACPCCGGLGRVLGDEMFIADRPTMTEIGEGGYPAGRRHDQLVGRGSR